jgi:hypothetical protein
MLFIEVRSVVQMAITTLQNANCVKALAQDRESRGRIWLMSE